MSIGKMIRDAIAGYIATAALDASQTSLIPAAGDWVQARLGHSDNDNDQPERSATSDDASSEPQLSSPAIVASRIASLAGVERDAEQAELWGIGTAKSPDQYPPRTHLDALAAHCVYGFVTGTVARGLQRQVLTP